MKRLLFVILTGLLALVFFVALARDMNREWADYQARFRKTLEPERRKAAPSGIQQILVTDFDRVDRCTSCHVAIERPQLALAEEPFTAHPGNLLESHPPEKFGCTVCHGGQGLATETNAAHGDVLHWEEPLLRGPLVQASCAGCHKNTDQIAQQVPLLVRGRQLFQARGCFCCHAVGDFGQTVSQDLTFVGSKPYQLMHSDFEMMGHDHDRIAWLRHKVSHARFLNPGLRPDELPPGEPEVYASPMPHFGLNERDVEALTVYLLSLKEFDPPASFVVPGQPAQDTQYTSRVAQGLAVFHKFGCNGCHGIEGVGGRKNWNAGLGMEVPSLLYVKAYYGDHLDALKELIRNGRQPTPRASPDRPAPPLYMPAWKDRISEADLDALIHYLFSLSERLPQPPPAPTDETAQPAS